MPLAYYNELDPYAAQWLRNLIAAGLIAPGDVDERDIRDVMPADLKGYTQCHFFAGVGVWSLALRRAGWPDDRPVWTGSCPCQPFSAAGRKGGFTDERHLWPAWHHLISVRRPPVVFGEQVASKDGLGWLDLVQADLEGTNYASAAADLCAAGVGAPHIRQRLWFVAERLGNTDHAGLEGRRRMPERANQFPAGPGIVAGGLADSPVIGDQREIGAANHGRSKAERSTDRASRCGSASGGLADTEGERRHRVEGAPGTARRHSTETGSAASGPGPVNGFWSDTDWLGCRDGKWRPVRSGTQPLAYESTSRVGRLRAYGNAIVAEVAATVVASYLDIERSADSRCSSKALGPKFEALVQEIEQGAEA